MDGIDMIFSTTIFAHSDSEIKLEKYMVKKQTDIYPDGLDLSNEYFIKNDL